MKKDIDGKVFYENSRGAWVPEESIKPLDLLREQVVENIHGKIKKLREGMAKTKQEIIEEIQAFRDIAAEEYGVALGSEKGNLQMTSFDGSIRIMLAINDSLTFTEGIATAQELINQCVSDWSKGGNQNLRLMVDEAFRLDQSGNMDVKRILSLRRLNISDGRWVKAMDIISESLKVHSSKQYFRVHERDNLGNYRMVDLDIGTM